MHSPKKKCGGFRRGEEPTPVAFPEFGYFILHLSFRIPNPDLTRLTELHETALPVAVDFFRGARGRFSDLRGGKTG